MSALTYEEAVAIANEGQRRADLIEPEYVRTLHPHQKEFWKDPARFKALLCGRRAGKTTVGLAKIAHTVNLYPDAIVPFLGLSKESAKRLAWKPLMDMNEEYGWGWKFNKIELIAYAPNGSQVWILGADKEADIEKIRGPKYHGFVIDEAASYRAHLKSLIGEVIEPALGDYRGWLWIVGTPGATCAGYFHDITTHKVGTKKWSVHSWTVRENTHFLDPEGWLAETLDSNGWTVDNPIYQREYEGRWYKDPGAFVYRFDPTRNVVQHTKFPLREYRLVMGLDFGVVDACAFTIWAYHRHERRTYVVRSFKHRGLAPSDFVDHINLLRKHYSAVMGRTVDDVFDEFVADTPGQGKAFAQELLKREGLHCVTAQKSEKLAAIQHFNGDLDRGHIVLLAGECEELAEEWNLLPWKDDAHTKYDENLYDDHNADSALYGWRRVYGYLADTPNEAPPDPKTREAAERRARQDEKEYERRLIAERALQADMYGEEGLDW